MKTEQFLEKNILIGLGFEKCGTTFLNKLLSESNIFLTPTIKETFFFNRHFQKGIEHYCSFYKSNPEQDYDFIVDITPSYLREGQLLLNNIKKFNLTRKGKSKYIICLRNQIYRAFSHYVHDLFHHWSKFDRKTTLSTPYNLSFFDEYERENNYYFTKYSSLVEQAFDILGKENILVLFQEKDISDINILSKKISEFLGVEFNSKFVNKKKSNDFNKNISLKSNSSSLRTRKIHVTKFPRFHFREFTDFKVQLSQGDYFHGKKGKLYLERSAKLVAIAHQGSAKAVMNAYKKWTQFLTGYEAEKIYMEYFENDKKQLEKLLGMDLSFWHNFFDVRY